MNKRAAQPKEIKALPAPKHRFPQYPRLFSANIISLVKQTVPKTVYWALFIGLISINMYTINQRVHTTALSFLKTNFHISPSLVATIDRLSSTFTLRTTDTSVLGDSQELIDHSLEALTREHEYWQTVIQTHPDYRDGYFALAVIAYRTNKFSESKTYLQKVRNLDPNFEPMLRLEIDMNNQTGPRNK